MSIARTDWLYRIARSIWIFRNTVCFVLIKTSGWAKSGLCNPQFKEGADSCNAGTTLSLQTCNYTISYVLCSEGNGQPELRHPLKKPFNQSLGCQQVL